MGNQGFTVEEGRVILIILEAPADAGVSFFAISIYNFILDNHCVSGIISEWLEQSEGR